MTQSALSGQIARLALRALWFAAAGTLLACSLVSGASDVLLHAVPLAVITVLLVSGRFLGEARIVSLLRRRAVGRRPRAASLRWPQRIFDRPRAADRCVTRPLRGPPSFAL